MVIRALCRCWEPRERGLKQSCSDDGEAFEDKHLFVFVCMHKEPVFLQISTFQLAAGEAGILFWCQELQAGDFEQLHVHLAESLVFSNPNVVVLGEESPPSSQRFPRSVVLIYSGYQFSFCPLLQALQEGWKISRVWWSPAAATQCWFCHGTAWGGSCAFMESSLFGKQSTHHVLPGRDVFMPLIRGPFVRGLQTAQNQQEITALRSKSCQRICPFTGKFELTGLEAGAGCKIPLCSPLQGSPVSTALDM